MGYISPQGEQSTSTEIDALTNLTDLGTSGAGEFIRKTGTDTFENAVPATGTDEKVKYDSGDPTAGYVSDKVVAGTGISVAEGTGGNENKLVITNTIDTLAEVSNTPTDPFASITGQTVIDEIGAIFTVEHEPTGISDISESTISFDNGTRTFTITPVGANFNYYIAGKKYTKTVAQTVVIDDTEGMHYIYFDGDTLTSSMVGNEVVLSTYAYVANVYWDATNNLALVFGDERHGLIMDNKTHSYLHKTRGTGLESGGALGDILVDQSGDTDSHAQFSNAATVIWDEDLKHSLTARNSTDTIGIYYRSGADASNIWRLNEATAYGVLTTGTGRAAYNQNNAGTWQLTEVSDSNFVLAHVFAFNDTTRRFGVIMGQDTYTTVANARAGAITEINSIILSGLPSQEFKFLGTVIYQTANAYTNAVKSRIRSTDGVSVPYVDLRSQIFPGTGSPATVTDHTGLSNLAWTSSGHTGTAANVAGFDGTGAATNYAIDIDLSSVSASDDTVPSAKATKAYADLMVPKSLYDANTVLYATTDNTPAALTVAEQTIVGRATGGAISALAIDSDLSAVSANDDTLPSAKATKAALDLKAPLTSPTFQTSINGAFLTASEILGTDGSKNIVSLPVATYPSLTELSYVKGVTSAIQTQIGTKAPTASPTFTGTVTLPKTTEIHDTSADHQYVLAVSELTADRIITLPLLTGTDTFVFQAHTQTLTNKRITKRVTTTTDDATAVIDVDTCDEYELSAVANATEFTTTGTPTDGQTLVIRLKDAGASKTLTWTGFTAIGITLPTATTAGKWTYVGCKYNSSASAWHAIAVTTQA